MVNRQCVPRIMALTGLLLPLFFLLSLPTPLHSVATVAGDPGYYVPGTMPRNYMAGDRVPLTVTGITSMKTHIPFDYYSLPHVCPPQVLNRKRENLGELVLGNREGTAPYVFHANANSVHCTTESLNVNCPTNGRTPLEERLSALIRDGYGAAFKLDGLPVAYLPTIPAHHVDSIQYSSLLVPLGLVGPQGKVFVNNHIHFTVWVREHDNPSAMESGPTSTFRVIRAVATPRSIPAGGDCNKADAGDHLSVREMFQENTNNRKMTYTVEWRKSDPSVTWAHRWDWYFDHYGSGTDAVRWYAIVNTTFALILIASMGLMVHYRYRSAFGLKYFPSDVDTDADAGTATIDADFVLVDKASLSGGGEDDDGITIEEEKERDAPPPPQFPFYLAMLVGYGCQLLFTATTVIGFAIMGFLSNANSGALLTSTILLFSLGSFPCGYYFARYYKMWCPEDCIQHGSSAYPAGSIDAFFETFTWGRGAQLKGDSPAPREGVPPTNKYKKVLVVAFLLPSVVFGVFCSLQIVLHTLGSSAALPLSTFCVVLALIVFVQVPLVVCAASFGFRVSRLSSPMPIPVDSKHPVGHPVLAAVAGFFIPLSTIFIELQFVLNGLLGDGSSSYQGYGTMAITFLFLVLASGVIPFAGLVYRDRSWWWKIFLTPALSGLGLSVYLLYYYLAYLTLSGWAPAALYFGYMTILCALFSILVGAVGVLASHFFSNRVHGSFKTD